MFIYIINEQEIYIVKQRNKQQYKKLQLSMKHIL